MHDLCPLCGTERVGAFRFCRRCRFDFDALRADPVAPPSERSQSIVRETNAHGATARRWTTARGLLGFGFVVAVGVAGLSTTDLPDLGTRPSAFSTVDGATPSDRPVAQATEARPRSTLAVSTPRSTLYATTDAGAGPNGTTTKADVVGVISGDTILVAFGGERHEVRYLGMSTPTAVGGRATAANAALVAGKAVVLEADASQPDRSGRLLRYVWVQQDSSWTLVNLELVRLGLATVAIDSPVNKYADLYVSAQAHARARQLGLWSPGPKAKPSTPPKPTKPPKEPNPPKETKPPKPTEASTPRVSPQPSHRP